jgi:uncharacterized caspase-like protein
MTEIVGNEFKRILRLRERDDQSGDFDTLVCKRLRGMTNSQVTEWIRGAAREKFIREQLVVAASQSRQVASFGSSADGVATNLLAEVLVRQNDNVVTPHD